MVGEIPQARGSELKKWVTAQNPRGGLTSDVYDLMASDATARLAVIKQLLSFFDGQQNSVIEDLYLAGPVFDGFGAVPGVTVGQLFANREALAAARVHRPNQSGICGTPAHGAESIVVSGGYEDDEDYGDEIIYTGEGGRDAQSKQQTHDQKLTARNAALVTSLTNGIPVRVIRGSGGNSENSPKSGLRYDGLFRVVDYWPERGKSGFLVWRYRLVQIDESDLPAPLPLPGQASLPLPAGQVTPPRVRTTTQRIVRSTAVAEFVKRTHDYTCQVCGTRLATPTGAYAEAAHIRALGRPHDGPDVAANVLCLCPNHHALFDFGMLRINDDLAVVDLAGGETLGQLRLHDRHEIDPRHLAYHRDHHAGLRGTPEPG
ncbi:YDG/SRA domain-containing protein [Kitasatospora acidiphila]|uniref:YDG/SRA domain-containing protein n=1 Tax=Kitasatospora acidiphila TaxID=2567942 RepID=UPI003C72F6A1